MNGSRPPGGCPDVDAYAALIGGHLDAPARAALERHIDACPNCTELVTELGRIYAQPLPATRNPEPRTTLSGSDPWVSAIAWSTTALLVGAGVVGWRALPSAWLVLTGGGSPAGTATGLAVLVLYAAAVGPLGALAGVRAALAAQRGRPRAAAATRALLWLAVPTLLLAPFAVFALLSLPRAQPLRARGGARHNAPEESVAS